MSAYFLMVLPLLIGNTWHAIMPFVGRKKTKFKNSISENALRSVKVLMIHRAIHILLSICFIIYAVGLMQQGIWLAAILLIIAATLDSLQVIFLSLRTNHTVFHFKDAHQMTAWLMAIFYLIYSFVLAYSHQVDCSLIAIYLLLLFIISLSILFVKHRYFWFSQMAYFVTVSAAMAVFAVV